MALDILIFKPLPMETIHKMMTEFLVRDDMKRMRVTAKEMNKIGSMVEEVIIQKEILKDHKREIENLEQSSVHLHVIAKKRGWDLPKQRAANSA